MKTGRVTRVVPQWSSNSESGRILPQNFQRNGTVRNKTSTKFPSLTLSSKVEQENAGTKCVHRLHAASGATCTVCIKLIFSESAANCATELEAT